MDWRLMLFEGGQIIKSWEAKHVCRRMLIWTAVRIMGTDCFAFKISSQKANKGC